MMCRTFTFKHWMGSCLNAVVLCLVAVSPVRADLIDRGSGLIYDTVLNVTWLQDANYSQTSGYDSDGSMHWAQAQAWAHQLVYAGLNDWRLPRTLPVNGVAYSVSNLSHTDPNGDVWGFGWDGTDDRGYNITSVTSELSYMYYVNLRNLGHFDLNGNHPQPGWGLMNVGPFLNLQSYHYWSETEYEAFLPQAWNLNFSNDIKNQNYKIYTCTYGLCVTEMSLPSPNSALAPSPNRAPGSSWGPALSVSSATAGAGSSGRCRTCASQTLERSLLSCL